MNAGASAEGRWGEGWRPLMLIALVCFLFLFFNPQIIADWRIYSFDDGTYSHAYLIPFICAYIAWKAARLDMLQLRWSWVFFLLAGTSLALYQWFDLAHQRYIARILVPACLTFSLLTVLRANRFTIAIGSFFWFITPVWGPINEILQWSSIKATGALMSLTGIPTFIYAEYVEIPAGTFEIADGCSGLRYVIAALALVAFYSVIFLSRARSMAILALAALVGAMVTNWLRIVVLILIGQFSNMEAEIIQDHNMFGWYLFFPFMLLLFYFAGRLEARDANSPSQGRPNGTCMVSGVNGAKIATLAITLILVSGLSLRLASGRALSFLTEELNVETAQPIQLPVNPAPRVYASSGYEVIKQPESNPRQITYKIGFDGSIDAQRAEFYLNNPIPQGWAVVEDTVIGKERKINVKRGSERGVITFYYQIGNQVTARRENLRWLRLKHAFMLNQQSSLVWTFTYLSPR